MSSEAGSGGKAGIDEALSDVEAWYTGALAEHGPAPEAVGWKGDEPQLRFEKLAYLIEADSPPGAVSVNDWGCGYGAMFDFLDERVGIELSSYRGYDISAEMIEAARERVTDSRAEFANVARLDEEADYTFVSGTFHVRAEADEATWAGFVRDELTEIAARSRRGFAFNLLTDKVDWRSDGLYYADPAEWFAFCRDNFSRRVTLLHDYPLYEWTIAVLKGDK